MNNTLSDTIKCIKCHKMLDKQDILEVKLSNDCLYYQWMHSLCYQGLDDEQLAKYRSKSTT